MIKISKAQVESLAKSIYQEKKMRYNAKEKEFRDSIEPTLVFIYNTYDAIKETTILARLVWRKVSEWKNENPEPILDKIISDIYIASIDASTVSEITKSLSQWDI